MAGLARCVCFVCFPRLSFVGFGGFPPGGEGKGPGRASGSGTWRGREGRASGKSIVWLQDRSRRQNKNLSEDLARSPSLPPSLSVCLSRSDLRCRGVGGGGGGGGRRGEATVRGPSPAQPTVSHSGKPSKSGGLGEPRRRSRARPGSRPGRGGGRRPAEWPEHCPGPGESA